MIPAEEWITAEAEDAWLCICGNQSHLDGFWPCTADGTEVEPTVDGPWDEKLVLCRRCGRIMDQSTYSGPGTWVLVVRGPGPMKLLEEAAP